LTVVAPGAFCFPGGGIELDESEEAALVRELREELRVDVCPVRKIWQSVTPWNVQLAWWLAELDDAQSIDPNEDEVASFAWHPPVAIAQLPGLLESNRHFLIALDRREFSLT
jgi:8-oxo-dGTP pyrophosphatase MutT (NUDIX family)